MKGETKMSLLVVKRAYKVNQEALTQIRNDLINQKAEGVVVIPIGFDAIVVPEDTEIKVEGAILSKEGNENE